MDSVYNHLNNNFQNLTIQSVSRNLGVSCPQIFVSAIIKDLNKPLPPFDKEEVFALARSACLTQNPDIIWQIFKVESHFRVNIVNIGGQKTLIGDAAKKYLNKSLKNDENIDIGPMQINWRANGSRYNYKPIQYLKGDFSVEFMVTYLLKGFVVSCKDDWVNCYHSFHQERGQLYRKKIDAAGLDLQKILTSFMKK